MGIGSGADFARFRQKARQFLRTHEDHLTILKLRLNEPLTAEDLSELQWLLVEAGVGTTDDLDRAFRESQGLGLFVRSLIGLDHDAAKHAFGDFLASKSPTANQIEFLNLIVDHLTENGVMDPGRLYESPFTDLDQRGPEGVFTEPELDDLIARLGNIRERALA